MMRYGLSGTCSGFTTSGGGPAGGHARPRAPPPHPTAVSTVPLRIATRMRKATCILSSPSLRKGVVRRCAAGEPVPERVRVVGQAPLLEDRQRHGPHPALAAAGGQALLVQPRFECVGLGVGGDRALEQVPLDRQADRVGGRVPLAPPPSPLRSVQRREQLATDLAGAGRRVAVHAPRPGEGCGGWGRLGEVGAGCSVTASTILHNLHQPPTGPRSAMLDSSAYPGRGGLWYPRSSAATSSGTVVKSSSRIAHGASGRTVVTPFRYPLQVWHTSILRVCSPASGVR